MYMRMRCCTLSVKANMIKVFPRMGFCFVCAYTVAFLLLMGVHGESILVHHCLGANMTRVRSVGFLLFGTVGVGRMGDYVCLCDAAHCQKANITKKRPIYDQV